VDRQDPGPGGKQAFRCQVHAIPTVMQTRLWFTAESYNSRRQRSEEGGPYEQHERNVRLLRSPSASPITGRLFCFTRQVIQSRLGPDPLKKTARDLHFGGGEPAWPVNSRGHPTCLSLGRGNTSGPACVSGGAATQAAGSSTGDGKVHPRVGRNTCIAGRSANTVAPTAADNIWVPRTRARDMVVKFQIRRGGGVASCSAASREASDEGRPAG